MIDKQMIPLRHPRIIQMFLEIDEKRADVANIAEDVHGFFERLVLVGEGNG